MWGQPYYGRAAEGTIALYLQLHDNPDLIADQNNAEPDYSKMTAAERKKAKAIARKKKKAAEKKAVELEEKQKAENNGKPPKKGSVDEDPDGTELLKKDPLEEARNFSSVLSKHSPGKVSTWILQFDISIRRKKTLMALQALFKAKSIDAESPDLFSRVVEFALLSLDNEHEMVLSVVKSELPALLNNCTTVEEYVTAAAAKVPSTETSLPMRVAIAKAMVKTSKCSPSDAAKLILEGGIASRGVSVASCKEALETLKEIGSGTDEWTKIVTGRLPLLKLSS